MRDQRRLDLFAGAKNGDFPVFGGFRAVIGVGHTGADRPKADQCQVAAKMTRVLPFNCDFSGNASL